jgi:hypothetical protein
VQRVERQGRSVGTTTGRCTCEFFIEEYVAYTVFCRIAHETGYPPVCQKPFRNAVVIPIPTTTSTQLPQRRKPVSPFARPLRLIRRRINARRSTTTSSVSIAFCLTPSTTYPSLCSLSFAFCQLFQRSSSLKLASRQLSFPGSSGLEPKWSLSRHEDEEDGFCAVAAGAAEEDVLMMGFLSESVSLGVVIIALWDMRVVVDDVKSCYGSR